MLYVGGRMRTTKKNVHKGNLLALAYHESLNALITDFGFDVLSLMPNVRCKSRFYNDSKFNFKVARYLPFRGFGGPFSFLKGRSTGIFCLATLS